MGIHGNKDKVQDSSIGRIKDAATTAATAATALAANVVTLDGTGTAIPTADPAVVGAIWANVGVLTVSAG